MPTGLLIRPVVRDALAHALLDWSEHWFPRRRFGAVRLVERSPSKDPRSDTTAEWTLYRGPTAVRCPAAKMEALLGAALGLSLDGLEPSLTDVHVLEGFGVRLMADLVERLEAAFEVPSGPRPTPGRTPDPFGRDGGLEVIVADERGVEILSLALPLAGLLPVCLRDLPAPPARSELPTLRDALGPLQITLEPLVGCVELGMSDLMGLSVGDLVVLDGKVDQPIALVLPGQSPSRLRADLSETDGKVALAFHDES